jgi:hypothetical protein
MHPFLSWPPEFWRFFEDPDQQVKQLLDVHEGPSTEQQRDAVVTRLAWDAIHRYRWRQRLRSTFLMRSFIAGWLRARVAAYRGWKRGVVTNEETAQTHYEFAATQMKRQNPGFMLDPLPDDPPTVDNPDKKV